MSEPATEQRLDARINVRISWEVLDEIDRTLKDRLASGVYTYGSRAEVIRTALELFLEDKVTPKYSESTYSGVGKTQVTLDVSEEVRTQWLQISRGLRGRILEGCVMAFLDQGLGS
jgi:Arc/MetJ-type ribon-helix-helix transcriptional regulator